MKINKILIYSLILLPAMLLQSCLKDDDDKFDQSAAARLETYLSEAQQTLVNAPYGWILDYYPQSSQAYGGYTYTTAFTKDTVSVGFELSPGQYEASLYSMKGDDGPVLSFDNYNSFIDYFATPSSDLNEGYNGDFEFVVDSIADDVVKVHGKRNMNTMYFRRLAEPADEYMNKVIDMGDSFGLYAAIGTIGGADAQAYFNRSNRQISIIVDSTTVTSAYNFTDKGIRLYTPITLHGQTISEITYTDDNLALTADGVQLSGIYDPSIIASAIGSVGSDDEAFSRRFNNLAHLDQVHFVTSADWVTVDANGTTVTVSATENNTGDVRSATVYVVSNVSGQVYDSFTVSQMNQSDILGNYAMLYYDYDNELIQASASIARSGNNLVLNVTTNLLGTSFNLSFPAVFNQSLGALSLQSGQIIDPTQYTLSSSSGRVSGYLMDAFYFNNESYWTVYYDNFYGHMPFQHNDTYGTFATLGTVTSDRLSGTYDFNDILIYFTTSKTPSSTDDLAGLIDIWQSVTLIKQNASGAKGNVLHVANGMKHGSKSNTIKTMQARGFKILK